MCEPSAVAGALPVAPPATGEGQPYRRVRSTMNTQLCSARSIRGDPPKVPDRWPADAAAKPRPALDDDEVHPPPHARQDRAFGKRARADQCGRGSIRPPELRADHGL